MKSFADGNAEPVMPNGRFVAVERDAESNATSIQCAGESNDFFSQPELETVRAFLEDVEKEERLGGRRKKLRRSAKKRRGRCRK